jgi:transposase-like protein
VVTKKPLNRDDRGDGEKSEFGIGAMALAELTSVLDREKSQAWLFRLLHTGRSATVCPCCGGDLTPRQQVSYRQFKKMCCNACGRQFNGTTGTPFHKVKLKAEEVLLITALVHLGVHPTGISRAVGRSKETVSAWVEKLSCLPPTDLRPDVSSALKEEM